MNIQQKLFLTGHYRNPNKSDGFNVRWSDLHSLSLDHPRSRDAIESFTRQDINYEGLVREIHGREPTFDGDIKGGAAAALLSMERCMVPDFPLSIDDLKDIARGPCQDFVVWTPNSTRERAQAFTSEGFSGRAIGPGNWPKCHGVGDYHASLVRWDMSGISDHLKPVFREILKGSQDANRELGCLDIHIDQDGMDLITGRRWEGGGRVNVEASFVQRSSGWVGLAQVMQGLGCAANMWRKFLAAFQPAALVADWITLEKHEGNHNRGWGHTRGGVNNPTLVRRLPTLYQEDDPITPMFRQRYGGKRVPLQPWETDGPEPPSPPDGDQPVIEGTLRIRGTEHEYIVVPKPRV